ncbi:unnamed protein product [Echinostoma caproni]|uniref:DUF4704 domain-containing protein n=1 Tax=Echinostoma caproni TaxID=27848 RepID=A0A183AM44_9TREM|nr:unnamed protein product [Echinostoma caproni]
MRLKDSSLSPSPTSTSTAPVCNLTTSARCWLMELLALLSTDSGLAVRLLRLGVMEVCHQVILSTTCKNPILSGSPHSNNACTTSAVPHWDRVACARATDPTNQLSTQENQQMLDNIEQKLCHMLGYMWVEASAELSRVRGPQQTLKDGLYYITTRFALKLLAHLLFHVDDAFNEFKMVYQESDPFKLVACYGHLTGAVPPAVPRLCHELPPGYRSKRTRTPGLWDTTPGTSSVNTTVVDKQPMNSNLSELSHRPVPVCSCVPSAHGTQAFLGLIRGLLYWRLVNPGNTRSVEAVDQFGNHVTSSSGLGMNADDVALLVIQPLTEGCLHVEDTRIFSWICHVLVLVLDQRTELHFWTVYTNSFVREMDNRVTALIKAVQAAEDGRNCVQFIEHLIPMVKLFACLASGSESIRVLLITDNLAAACRGHSLCADLVEAASCALVNILLPQSPIRQKESHPLMDSCLDVLIRLITVTESGPVTSPQNRPDIPALEETQIETTPELRMHHTLSAPELLTMLLRLRLNGIWGLVNFLHGASAVTCSELFDRLVSDGVWLDLLRPLATNTHNSTAWTNPQVNHTPTTRRCSTGSVNRLESKTNKLRTRSMILPESASIRDPMFFPPLSLTPPDERLKPISPPSLPSKRAGSEKPVSPTVPEEGMTSPNHQVDAHVQTMLLHKTLMFLHNLLRHEKVIDMIVKEHWWNITQLLVSVLEGNYPQPVKEQRSPDSHIKAAALTATYNLLGLGRDPSDYGLIGSSRTHSDPFLSHQWRLYHRHHRQKDRHRRKVENLNRSTTSSSTAGPSTRRDVATCVAQSALEEAEEEIEEEEEQDIVLEHAVMTEEGSLHLPGARDSISHRALQTDEVLTDPSPVVQDSTVSFSGDRPLAPLDPSSSTSFGRRTFTHQSSRRWWHLSPTTTESSFTHRITPSTTQTRATAANATLCSLSASSSSSSTSSTSSTSCAEDLASTVVQVPDLDQSTTQDTGAFSSTSCSEAELNVTTPSIDQHSHDDTMAESLALDARAPLASQEGADETESQAVQLTRVYSTDAASQTAGVTAFSGPVSSSQSRWGDSRAVRKETDQTSSRHQPWSGSLQQQFVCPRRSRRDLETGFRQILLPFLQELESDQLLRNTWDWLMLRANTRGKPVPLHHLFVAWQRLYNMLPSGSPPHTISDTLNIESNLFNNCVTVDAFLRRLKDSSNPTCSTSLLAAIPRHRDGRHRRRHHHCHRHQSHGQNRHMTSPRETTTAAVTDGASTSTPVPPVTTSEEVERTDEFVSDDPSGRN